MRRSIYNNENKLLTTWLVEQRNNVGLTQRELANMLDIHHSIVGKIETGERKLNVVEFVEYCLKLNIDPCYILKQIQQEILDSSAN